MAAPEPPAPKAAEPLVLMVFLWISSILPMTLPRIVATVMNMKVLHKNFVRIKEAVTDEHFFRSANWHERLVNLSIPQPGLVEISDQPVTRKKSFFDLEC